MTTPASLMALAATAFLLSLPPLPAFAVCGDVSGDDKVTTSDALRVLKKSVGQDPALTCDLCGEECAGNLRFLLGEWVFQSDFGNVLEDHYDLFSVDEADCFIVGQDLDDGGIVFAREGFDQGYDYVLLDPGDSSCDFFVFNRTGDDAVDGFDVLLDVGDNGCGDPISGIEHAMVGDRVVSALAASGAEATEAVGSSRRQLDHSSAVAPMSNAALDPVVLDLIERVKALSATRRRGR